MDTETKAENLEAGSELHEPVCSRLVHGQFDISKGVGPPVWQNTEKDLTEDEVDEVLSWYNQYPRRKVIMIIETYSANTKLDDGAKRS